MANRVGHAARGLASHHSGVRLQELAHALAAWASAYEPLAALVDDPNFGAHFLALDTDDDLDQLTLDCADFAAMTADGFFLTLSEQCRRLLPPIKLI